MKDTLKFMAILMGDFDSSFAEEYGSFSEEDQNLFIDALCTVSIQGLTALKGLPLDIKTQAMQSALGTMTQDQREAVADVLSEMLRMEG